MTERYEHYGFISHTAAPEPNPQQMENVIFSMLYADAHFTPTVHPLAFEDREDYLSAVDNGTINESQYSVFLESIVRRDNENDPTILFHEINNPVGTMPDERVVQQMKRVLGYVIYGKMNAGKNLGEYDLAMFLQGNQGNDVLTYDYITNGMLTHIENRFGFPRRFEYELATTTLGKIIYGKQWEYLMQIRLLEQEAISREIQSEVFTTLRQPSVRIRQPREKQASPEQIRELEAYIASAIAVIKEGSFKKAAIMLNPSSFKHIENARQLGVHLGAGETWPVNRLLTEDHVISAIRTVASHSRTGPNGSLEIASYHVRNFKDFKDYPQNFKPELVKNFKYEYALLCAEEWLHALQIRKMGPVAGQINDEVDIAAYFYQHGLPLSYDFITRYHERAEWYIQLHPDEEENIRIFQNKWG